MEFLRQSVSVKKKGLKRKGLRLVEITVTSALTRTPEYMRICRRVGPDKIGPRRGPKSEGSSDKNGLLGTVKSKDCPGQKPISSK